MISISTTYLFASSFNKNRMHVFAPVLVISLHCVDNKACLHDGGCCIQHGPGRIALCTMQPSALARGLLVSFKH